MTAEIDIRAQLRPERDGVRIFRPPPGRLVLMCRCGKALDLSEMRRPRRGRTNGDAPRVDPITCERCAT